MTPAERSTFEIAVYPGDGIGVDVIQEAVRVLRAVESMDGGFTLCMTDFPWGADYFEQTGTVVPGDFLVRLAEFDAILLGALGWPEKLPDHITLAPLKQIRQQFDQYACVRPARLMPGAPRVLAGKTESDIDLVVIRENSEGEYVDNGGRFRRGQPDEVAIQTAIHSRRGVERILRFAFELAGRRRGRLTMVTKSNAMGYGYVLWDELLVELAPEYPHVESERQHCDVAAMNFIRQPERFDVVVASNLFGDLLTDLGAVIAGGLGLAPSSNTNPERRFPSMFEPVHGSAPDIVGRGIANPVAAILCAAMMLDHLGQRGAARRIEGAVQSALRDGCKTADLDGHLNTKLMTDRILDRL